MEFNVLKYEEILNGNDQELKTNLISFLTVEHINNSLSKKDNITNNVLDDLGEQYMDRFIKLYESIHAPLGYYNDFVNDLFLHVQPHIKTILNNPHKSIIKEKTMVPKSNLKVVDANTFKWLGTKPGSSFKEKLANQNKVLSTKKRYTFDIKENQVLRSLYRMLNNHFNQKLRIIKTNDDIFGSEDHYKDQLQDIKRYLTKIKRKFQTELEEVSEKHHSTPNNALIGNVNYSSVWKTYRKIINFNYHFKESFSNTKQEYVKVLFKMLVLALMSNKEHEFVDYPIKITETEELHYVIYKINDNQISEYKLFLDEHEITIVNDVYMWEDNQYLLKKTNNYVFEISFLNNSNDATSNRGILFQTKYEDEVFDFHADMLGIKEYLHFIFKLLKINFNLKESNVAKKLHKPYISINSFDNIIYMNEENVDATIVNDDVPHKVKKDAIYYINNDKNVYLSSYSTDIGGYGSLLKLVNKNCNNTMNNILIYDVLDVLDEFSSMDLRGCFTSNIPNSYPVWRSILAGESVINKDNIKYVVDLTGSEFYIAELARKNGLYIHEGPVEHPLYAEIINEQQILFNYLRLFSEKYDLSISDTAVQEIIKSGRLNDLLHKKDDKIYTFLDGTYLNHDYVSVFFDLELYIRSKILVESFIARILANYENHETLFILPNFLEGEIELLNQVTNSQLFVGANVIRERVVRNEVCWYEKLPNLSLEVIRNGYYDTLELVKNQECENIIGKKTTFTVSDTFTLTKGKKDYMLPLNKSFIGEKNKSYVAYIRDKAFPLLEDIEVDLRLEYKYGSENSYDLVFKPIDKSAPFKELTVEWTELDSNNNPLINPKIHDVQYSDSKQQYIFNNLIKKANSVYLKKYLSNGYVHNDFSAIKFLKEFTNDFQRLYFYNQVLIEQVVNEIEKSGMVDLLLNFINKSIKLKFKNRFIEIQLIKVVEETLVSISKQSKELILKNRLSYPENCYGRYFAYVNNDEEVVNHAFNKLCELASLDHFPYNNQYREYIMRLTAATAIDHRAIYKLNETSVSYTNYLFRNLKNVIKELPKFEYHKKREVIFYMGSVIDLLIAFLFLREKVSFSEFLPNKRDANEVVYYLKQFNKQYINIINNWSEEDGKRTVLKSKYKMTPQNKPSIFGNVVDEIYCLILFLTGNEEANYITIEG